MVDIFEKGVDNLNNITFENEFNESVAKISSFASYKGEHESSFAKKMKDKFKTNEEMYLFIKVVDIVFENIKETEDYLSDFNFDEVKEDFDKLKKILIEETLNLLSGQLSVDDLIDYPNILDEHIRTFKDNLDLIKVELNDEDNEKEKSLNKKVFVLSETVNNKANVDEILNDEESKEQDDDTVHHPLWYVLNKVDEKNSEKVDVEDDEESLHVESVDFYGKEVRVGDKTKINFTDNDKKSSVFMGSASNSLNIAHYKKEDVSKLALNSTFKGVIDYMSANDDVPFDFVINTKTSEFKKEFIGSIIMYSIKDRMKDKIKDNDIINSVSKEPLLAGKISSFVIDGVKISYNDFSTFNTYEDFVKFEDKLKNKDKEDVHKRLLENEIINNVAR